MSGVVEAIGDVFMFECGARWSRRWASRIDESEMTDESHNFDVDFAESDH